MNFHNQDHMNQASMAQGFMVKVYSWMCVGLAVSASVAYYMFTHIALMQRVVSSFGIQLGLIFGMLGIVFFIGAQFQKLSYPAVALLYTLFAVLEGVFLAPILLVYTGASVINVFVTASLMFVGMALYGWITKSDLSSMGNLMTMALWGLILSMFVNWFLQSDVFSLLISSIAVGVFAMLVAYDVQNLKRLSQQMVMTPSDANKIAIMGALNLYLNMINLFLHLLRLFGQRRD